MEKKQEHSAGKEPVAGRKEWRKLHAPLPRPDPVYNTFAWTVGIGLALLFLILVAYAYLVYRHA